MDRSITLTDNVLDYIQQFGVREHESLAQCRRDTQAQEDFAIMQISPEQGAFMAMLIKLVSAKKCLEVGVFTGYSTLNAALTVPDDGKVVACELSPTYLAKAESYWQQAGVAHKIETHLGPATDSLRKLIDSQKETFDFAFIDANKEDYDSYYEHCLSLVRSGGLIAIDNVLWSGAVVDETDQSESTVAIRTLNEKVSTDSRVDICLTGIGDGIFLCRKR